MVKITGAAGAMFLLAVLLTGCGGDDVPRASRTIEVQMTDNVFSPDSIDVAAGETIRFEFANDGEVVHEAFVGTEEQQMGHAEEMAMAEGDDGHGGMGDSATSEAVEVEPGQSADLEVTFDSSGPVLVGCHQPGHYEDGMRMTVDVA